MTDPRPDFVLGVKDLLARAAEGVDAIAAWTPPAQIVAPPAPAPALGALQYDTAIYDVVRAMLPKQQLSSENFALLQRAIVRAQQPAPIAPPAGSIQIGLTDADFKWAAGALDATYPQVRAVDDCESRGAGFETARSAILALDGEGGFIDGSHLPKILFEAHKFSKHTGHRFDASHPKLSSAKWNRSLYVGGQGEWARLDAAMDLDRSAALKSASAGRYQILGENYVEAGFVNVEDFWTAMKAGELDHLRAFVSFVKKAGLSDELRRVSSVPADCAPFAAGYNGPGYAANNYDDNIAAAHAKWSKAA